MKGVFNILKHSFLIYFLPEIFLLRRSPPLGSLQGYFVVDEHELHRDLSLVDMQKNIPSVQKRKTEMAMNR